MVAFGFVVVVVVVAFGFVVEVVVVAFGLVVEVVVVAFGFVVEGRAMVECGPDAVGRVRWTGGALDVDVEPLLHAESPSGTAPSRAAAARRRPPGRRLTTTDLPTSCPLHSAAGPPLSRCGRTRRSRSPGARR